jgi:hypothetical protein
VTEDKKKQVFYSRPKGDSYEEFRAWFVEFVTSMLGAEKAKDIDEEGLHEMHAKYVKARKKQAEE